MDTDAETKRVVIPSTFPPAFRVFLLDGHQDVDSLSRGGWHRMCGAGLEEEGQPLNIVVDFF